MHIIFYLIGHGRLNIDPQCYINIKYNMEEWKASKKKKIISLKYYTYERLQKVN